MSTPPIVPTPFSITEDVRVAFADGDVVLARDGRALTLPATTYARLVEAMTRHEAGAISALAYDDDHRALIRSLFDDGFIIGSTDSGPRPVRPSRATIDPAGAQSGGAIVLPPEIGPYRLVRLVGRGSFGTVFEAIRTDVRQTVGLKILNRSDVDHVVEFKREVRRVADVRHPNLAIPYELICADDVWCFAMELVAGQPLDGHIAEAAPGAARIARIRNVFAQLADAVCALHEVGLLHLDLKPANVLVQPDDRVVVLDFGLVRELVPRANPSPVPNAALGTPAYASPEQLAGRMPSSASDWYSLGVMLFESLTGELPEAETRPSRLVPTTPSDLDELCGALLQPDPTRRPSAHEVLSHLPASSSGSSATRRSSPLLGRDEEMARLQNAWALSRAGETRCVWIEGAAGIGKSALVDSFLRGLMADHSPPFVLAGRCYAREAIPFKGADVLIEVLAEILARPSFADLRAAWGAALLRAGGVFPALRGLTDAPSASSAPSTDPIERRRHAFSSVRELIRAVAARAPIILSIDDIHWADRDSADLLGEVLAPPCDVPLFAIFTHRPREETTNAFFDEWKARMVRVLGPVEEHLALRPIEAQAALHLATTLLPDGAASDTCALLVNQAGGNPLLMEELARHVHKAPLASDGPHDHLLDDLVWTRLQAMHPDAQRLVWFLALVGRPMSQALLREAAESPPDMARLLGTLRDHVLVQVRGLGAEDEVEIWHDRIRDAVLQQLPPGQATAFHLILAEVMTRSNSDASECAFHFAAGGRPQVAAGYALIAAEQASAALAFERAAELYAAALDWGIADGVSRIAALRARAEALFNAGRSADAAPAFLAAANADEDPKSARTLRLRAAESWLTAGHVDDAVEVLAQLGVALAPDWKAATAVVSRLIRLSLRRLGDPIRVQNELPPELEFQIDRDWVAAKGLVYVLPLQGSSFLLRSATAALKAGNPLRIGRALSFLGAGLFSQVPLLQPRGRRYLQIAADLGRRFEDDYLLGVADVWHAFSEVYPGHWTSMLEAAQRGATRLESNCLGVHWEVVIARGLSCWALQLMGELAESRSLAATAMRAGLDHGDLYSQVLFAQYLAYSEIAAGAPDRARARARWIVDNWTARAYTVQHFYSDLLQSMCDIYQGNPEAAAERTLRQRASFSKSGGNRVPMSRIDHAMLQTRIRLSLDEARASSFGLPSCARVAAEMEKEQRSDGSANAALIRACDALRAGHRREARHQLEICERLYRGADMRLPALCARRRRATLAGDRDALAEIDLAMHALGVGDPARWTEVFMPTGDSGRDDIPR